MDTQILADFIANIISFLMGFMKNVDLTPIAKALETVTPYIKGALYFLPANTIAQIFAITCAIWAFRLTIKTIVLIWNLLPIA